jgi:cytochrome P450
MAGAGYLQSAALYQRGGAHMCIGLHFAYMQAKCFAYHLLTTLDVSAAPNYRPDWKLWPIPQPRDGLQLKLTPRQ